MLGTARAMGAGMQAGSTTYFWLCHQMPVTLDKPLPRLYPGPAPAACAPTARAWGKQSLTLTGFLLFFPVLRDALLSTLKLHPQVTFGHLLGSLGARGPLLLATSTPFV